MENTKHTPGPWILAGNAIVPASDPETEFPIAVVYGKPNAAANGSLLAAAPDMLDSFKGLLYELRQHFPGIETPVSSAAGLKAEYLAAAEAITRVEGHIAIRKAIPKAEGE